MYTELIGTIGRENADAAGADFHLILTAGCSRDGKGICVFHIGQWNACKELPILIDVCNVPVCLIVGKQNVQQAGESQ